MVNGYRYRSVHGVPALYLAVYDLARVSGLGEPNYTVLREQRSPREAQLIGNKLNLLDRRIYKDISSRGTKTGRAPVLMTVIFKVEDEHVPELNRWYEEVSRPQIERSPF